MQHNIIDSLKKENSEGEYVNKVLSSIFIFVSILFFILGIYTKELDLALSSILLLFFGIVIYSIILKEKALLLTFFLISFFTFLLGQYTLGMITGLTWWKTFSFEITKHILISLYLSLFSLFIGFYLAHHRDKNKKKIPVIFLNVDNNIVKAIKILFYITLIFQFVVVLEQVVFVQNSTYLNLYTSYNSKLPYVFIKFGDLFYFAYYALLSTMPKKSEIKMPTILFLIIALLTILTGARGNTVIAVMIVSMYFIYRELHGRKINNTKYEWVKRWYIYLAMVLTPLIIAFLSAYSSIRSGVDINDFNLFSEIMQFFHDQGGSVNIIGYVKYYENQLPSTNISYFFGPIISFISNGFLGSLFTGKEFEINNLIQTALFGNNLGATITYIIMPENYLIGIGLGTQYIAEVYIDFGYVGIIGYNLFLGFLIYKFNFNQTNKWYINAIIFSVYPNILFIARDFALTWVAPFLSILYWTMIFIIIIIANTLSQREKQ